MCPNGKRTMNRGPETRTTVIVDAAELEELLAGWPRAADSARQTDWSGHATRGHCEAVVNLYWVG